MLFRSEDRISIAIIPSQVFENVESVIAKHRYCDVARAVLCSRSLIERLAFRMDYHLTLSVLGL